MSNVVIYENNFQTRKYLEKELVTLGYNALGCYSLKKLEYFLEKYKHSGYAVAYPNDASESKEIKQRSKRCIVYPSSKENEAKLQVIKNQLIENKEYLRKNGDKKILDLLCIGSSTGGLPVVQKILKNIHPKQTIIIICQHISKEMGDEIFESITKNLNSSIRVVKVEEEVEINRGGIYILSGGKDYKIRQKYNKFYLALDESPKSIYHPSYESLLHSLSKVSGLHSGCIFLSGLGNDGSNQVVELKKMGVHIIAQNPKESIAPYMPTAAIETGAVSKVLDTHDIHEYLKRSVQ